MEGEEPLQTSGLHTLLSWTGMTKLISDKTCKEFKATVKCSLRSHQYKLFPPSVFLFLNEFLPFFSFSFSFCSGREYLAYTTPGKHYQASGHRRLSTVSTSPSTLHPRSTQSSCPWLNTVALPIPKSGSQYPCIHAEKVAPMSVCRVHTS